MHKLDVFVTRKAGASEPEYIVAAAISADLEHDIVHQAWFLLYNRLTCEKVGAFPSLNEIYSALAKKLVLYYYKPEECATYRIEVRVPKS